MATPPAGRADAVRQYAARVDFGKTSEDYARFRPGPPASFYERLNAIAPLDGRRALDVGTGTGVAAIEMAARGARVTALDISEGQLEEARRLAAARGLGIDFRRGRAEETGVPSAAFDLYLALQCWHWFDAPRAAAEAFRLVRPGGVAAIAHFDYIAGRSPVAARTEELVLKHNPAWPMAGGTGCYVRELFELPAAGFTGVEQFSYEHAQPFTHASWRGRMRACNGVGASLSPAQVAAFDAELGQVLAREFPAETLQIVHRVWVVYASKPT
jgi:SAM-dependent methyltransferase